MNLSTSEILMYSIVRLTTFRGGLPISNGTGFYRTTYFGDDKMISTIITNKHVVAGADSIQFVLHLRETADGGPSGRLKSVTVPLAEVLFEHPDPTVDLCAIAITANLTGVMDAGEIPFTVSQSDDTIPTGAGWNNFDGVEEVLMIGCPSGLYDATNNLPLCRRGITATPLSKDYNGKREFVIDMACFPGSSGSPIFVFNRDGYLNRAKNAFMMGQSRLNLVGILYAGPNVNNRGEIVMATPGVNVQTMMHLGYAIKADRLFEIDEVMAGVVGMPLKRLQGNA